MAGRGYRLTDRAILDLQEIVEYLSERSHSASDHVLDALYDTFGTIAQSDGMGTSLERHRPGLRMSIGIRPAHKYAIFHREASERILITRVLHGARNWTALLEQDEL